MFETASAQSIGLFQSPSLLAVERLLGALSGRVAGLDRFFLSRQESFIERVFSRHFDAIGLPEWRQLPAVRTLPAASWNSSSSWVAAPREVRPPAAAPARTGTPVSGPVGGTPSSRPVATPARTAGSPSASLPIVTPEAAPAPTAVRPASGLPLAAPASPSRLAEVVAKPMPTGERAPAIGQLPPQPDAPMAAVAGPGPGEAATPRPAPSEAAAESPFPPPRSEPPFPGLLTDVSSLMSPTRATVAEPATPSLPEQRVRDLLPAPARALSPFATDGIPAPAPARAKSFAHLSWADAQLSRSPVWRAATLPSLLSSPLAPTVPSMTAVAPSAPAMPMLQTPDLRAPARARDGVTSVGRPVVPAPVPAAAAPVVTSRPSPAGAVSAAAPASSTLVSAALPSQAEPGHLPLLRGEPRPAAVAEAATSAAPAGEPGAVRPLPATLAVPDLAGIATVASSPESSLAPPVAVRPGEAGSVPREVAFTPASSSPVAAAVPASPRLARPAPVSPALAPTWSAAGALRIDPGLLPQQVTPELAHLLVGPSLSSVVAPSVSWAQPGGLWSQPAWSQMGILSRLADGPLNTQLAAWRVAPGVPATVLRSVAEVAPARVPSSSSASLARPWVAPEVAPALSTRRPASVPSATAREPLAPTLARSAVRPSAPTTEVQSQALGLAPAGTPDAVAPTVGLPVAAQPWRQPGGMAALAELFAAGVGLGSAASATSAQLQSEGGRPALVADWLQPLLGRGTSSVAAPMLGGMPHALFTSLPMPTPAVGGAPLVSIAGPAPGRQASAGMVRSPLGALPFLPAPTVTPTALTGPAAAQTAMAAVASRAVAPTATRPVVPPAMSSAVEEPAVGSTLAGAAAPVFAGPGSPMPVLPLGGLGLMAQQFAGLQSLRTVSSGLPLVAEGSAWAAAPGLPASLQRDLLQARAVAGAPTVAGVATPSMPYLSLLPGRPSQPASVKKATPAATELQLAATLQRTTPASSTPTPATAPGVTPARVFPGTAPWFAPGGGGTLAELFATGIATTSGASAWLSQLHENVSSGVVPAWVGSWLAAQLTGTSTTPVTLAGPGAEAGRSLPYLGADAARPGLPPGTPQGRAPLAAPVISLHRAAAPATVVAPTLTSTAAAPSLSRLGQASVRAEQFASQQGLAAPPIGAGTWADVTGGLVWLPTPAASPESPRLGRQPSAAPGSATATGSLGLRSELFVRNEQARVLGPSQGMVRSLGLPMVPAATSEAPPASAARFTRGGGMVYLPKAAQAPSLATAARPLSRGVHVSPMELARPWGTLPAELSRLGYSSFPMLAGARYPMLAQPGLAGLGLAGTAPAAAPRLSVRQLASLPVLSSDSLRSEPEVRLTRSAPTPTVVSRQQPYELAARFASSMLTAFPPQETRAAVSKPEAARPQMLWPQTAAVSQERIQRVLAMLPAALPASGPLAALAELVKAPAPNAGTGMPLWQRMPGGLLAPTAPAERDASAADETEQGGESSTGPELTLIRGDSPARARRSSEPAARPSPSPSKPASPPPVEVFKAALAASGASREHVEASAKLLQVIQGQTSGGGSRGDDRLSLEDLTLVAISMGQGKMAAAATAGTPHVPSVEAAIGLPPAQHPTVAQDDREVRRKLDRMAEHVAKQVKDLKKDGDLRGGFSM